MSNEHEITDAELTALQIEADRYNAYQAQRCVVQDAEEKAERAREQFFTLGEGIGDWNYWQRCQSEVAAARAALVALD